MAACIWLLVTASVTTLSAGNHDRRARSRQAERFLRDTSLFANGEGIHSVPFFWERVGQAISVADLVPGLRKRGAQVAVRRWGFVEIDGELEGVAQRAHGGMSVAAVTCVVCHGGKAAGRFYPGLGNKNIDVSQLGQDSYWSMLAWSALQPGLARSSEQLRLEASSLAMYRRLGDRDRGNLTQGLVAVSFIKSWFYRAAGQPLPANMPRQQVKVPAFWGYSMKTPIGEFADGMGDATEAGWMAMVELTAGQSPDTVRRNYPVMRRLKEEIGHILPPAYPFAVDGARARSGEVVFKNECSQCHGTYERDAQGLAVFRSPAFVEWPTVGTDPDRIAVFDPGFNRLIDTNPLNAMIRRSRLTDGPAGYVAPRLDGIWARFPYLHNGSVPTVDALLQPQPLRPRAFLLRDAGEAHRFDTGTLGLTMPLPASPEARALEALAATGARDVTASIVPGTRTRDTCSGRTWRAT